MRQIKLFEDFESEDSLQTLKDICLELEDEGLKVSFKNSIDYGFKRMLELIPELYCKDFDFIDITKDSIESSTFKFSHEIENCLNRIKLYLGDSFSYCPFQILDEAGYHHWVIDDDNLFNFSEYNGKITRIIIIYNVSKGFI